MNKKQYWSILVFAVLAGFVGGAVASWLFTTQPVFAEKKSHGENLIQARMIMTEQLMIADKTGVHILVGPGPLVHISDSSSKAKVSLDMFLGPCLRLNDKNGKIRAALHVKRNGEPRLSFLDEKGIVRAALGAIDLEAEHSDIVEKRPVSSLVLFNKDGKVIWSVP